MSRPEQPPRPHGLRLTIAYDGSEFAGYQCQPEQRTVQTELEHAIARMAGHAVSVRSAGRTDAGVHALAQVVAFDADRDISPVGWRKGLNSYLPPDLRVQSVEPCEPGYAPRFDAMGKHYRYVIELGEIKNPLLRKRAWQLPRPPSLPLDLLRAGAAQLVGRHDFRAFRAADDVRDNTMRTLYAVDLVENFGGEPNLIAFDVRGDAFMKNMVRILVGTLVDIGRGRRTLAQLAGMLGPQATRQQSGTTAPAHGLTLIAVSLGRKAAQARLDAERAAASSADATLK